MLKHLLPRSKRSLWQPISFHWGNLSHPLLPQGTFHSSWLQEICSHNSHPASMNIFPITLNLLPSGPGWDLTFLFFRETKTSRYLKMFSTLFWFPELYFFFFFLSLSLFLAKWVCFTFSWSRFLGEGLYGVLFVVSNYWCSVRRNFC